MAPVLKTGMGKLIVGSNPTPSADTLRPASRWHPGPAPLPQRRGVTNSPPRAAHPRNAVPPKSRYLGARSFAPHRDNRMEPPRICSARRGRGEKLSDGRNELTVLYERDYARLVRFAALMVGSVGDAEEIVQDA